ncbi:MAG: substrate-binding domain-containing protein, partial [Pseudomonadota bacterium]|nr:substrate-binding domain-containing protein [Pseudomonadota bacterium]
AIADSGALFVSRGDGSGTHRKELALWKGAGREVAADGSSWYLEVGSGMGATLNIAIGKGAYTLTDRASWEMFGNKMDFEVLVEGDKALFNQYGVMVVSAEKCPDTNVAGGQAFLDWLISDDGQGRIAAFRPMGKQLFFPNAR